MTKHFEWRMVYKAGESPSYPAILKLEDGMASFCGVLQKSGDLYRAVVFNKDRTSYMEMDELLSFSDAKLAVEKKLFDDGVIEDNDILNDYTE